MKNKINLFKIIITAILTIGIIFSITNTVFAEEDDNILAILDGSNNTTNNSTNNSSNDEYENAVEKNVIQTNNTTNNTSNNNTNKNTNNNISNTNTNLNKNTTNSLADTGIGDVNSVITLIIIVSGIVAIYSYKKLNDYKKL